MRKRIGSRLYDTETSELVQKSGLGSLYRKRSRDREWFLVSNDGVLDPIEDAQALAILGENNRYGRISCHKPEPLEYRIRVDQDTYNQVNSAAKAAGVSMSEIIRRLVKTI